MRIPIKYLANLLAAGDEAPVRFSLKRLIALRGYMRSVRLGSRPDPSDLDSAEMSESMAREMYRLLALAKYQDRYVIPTAAGEMSKDHHSLQKRVGYPERDSS